MIGRRTILVWPVQIPTPPPPECIWAQYIPRPREGVFFFILRHFGDAPIFLNGQSSDGAEKYPPGPLNTRNHRMRKFGCDVLVGGGASCGHFLVPRQFKKSRIYQGGRGNIPSQRGVFSRRPVLIFGVKGNFLGLQYKYFF